MATKKLTESNKTGVLNDLKNNTGTSRADEYYFLTEDINVEDLHNLAFKKDTIIDISFVNSKVSKLIYLYTLG